MDGSGTCTAKCDHTLRSTMLLYFFFLLSSSVGHLLSQFMSHVRELISLLFISPISSPNVIHHLASSG
ncbi:rCG61903 [Rattus norvegicus]|uniref:RCG61903 n=1 Tax=Rattus norvegicus TaxID=10116 RepID=A6HAI1_RAT|nr:rCG61903 [Rattus norvegicus]